jgi:hypothetical protein
MSFSTEKQTKAEQLARELDASVIAVYKDAAVELRRLSSMEAQLADEKLHVKQLERGIDKLLAVNKVLVEALKEASQTLAWQQLGECRGFSEKLLPTVECLNNARQALKLAGEIK